MNARITIAVLIFLLCTAAGWCGEIRKRAVLVGVTEYSHRDIPDLRFCANDVLDFRAALVAGGFDEQDISVLYSGASDSQFEPSRENILRELKRTLSACGDNDLVIFAFSGHGFHVGKADYLAGMDSDYLDANSMVSVEFIRQQFNRSKAGRKVAFLDACRSSMSANDNFRYGELGKGTLVVASCDDGKASYEHEDIQHGVFMHSLISGLTRADSDDDGQIELFELLPYLNNEVQATARQLVRESQKPHLHAAFAEFALCNKLTVEENPLQLPELEATRMERTLFELANGLFIKGKNDDAIRAFEEYVNVGQSQSLLEQGKRQLIKAYVGSNLQDHLVKALALNTELGDQQLVLKAKKPTSVMDGTKKLKNVNRNDELSVVGVTTFREKLWCRISAVDGTPLAKAGFVLIDYLSKDGYAIDAGVAEMAKNLNDTGMRNFVQTVKHNQHSRPQQYSTIMDSFVQQPFYGRFAQSSEGRQVMQHLRAADRSYSQADRLYDRGRPVMGALKEWEGVQKEWQAERQFRQWQDNQPRWGGGGGGWAGGGGGGRGWGGGGGGWGGGGGGGWGGGGR